MKRKILISIHPEHVQNILNGTKKYEYRKIVAKQTINSMLIYETSPTMKIVAEVDVKGVLTGAPDEIWRQTYNSSGITKFSSGEVKSSVLEGSSLLFVEPSPHPTKQKTIITDIKQNNTVKNFFENFSFIQFLLKKFEK